MPEKPPFQLPKFTVPKADLPEVLPRNISALTGLLHAQQADHLAAVESLYEQFGGYLSRIFEQVVLDRHRLFGASSEQGRLFDEAEAIAANTTEAQDTVWYCRLR